MAEYPSNERPVVSAYSGDARGIAGAVSDESPTIGPVIVGH